MNSDELDVTGQVGNEATAEEEEEHASDLPTELPILPLKNTVVYPLTVLPLLVQKPRSVRLVDDAVVADKTVALVALRDPSIEEPGPEDLYDIGTVAVIHRLARAPDGTLHIIVQGLERVRLTEFTQRDPYMRARIAPAPEVVEETVEIEALRRSTLELFRRLVELAAYLPEEVVSGALEAGPPPAGLYGGHQHPDGPDRAPGDPGHG